MSNLIEKAHTYGTDLATMLFPTRNMDDTDQVFETSFIGSGKILTRKDVPDQYRHISNRENNYL